MDTLPGSDSVPVTAYLPVSAQPPDQEPARLLCQDKMRSRDRSQAAPTVLGERTEHGACSRAALQQSPAQATARWASLNRRKAPDMNTQHCSVLRRTKKF